MPTFEIGGMWEYSEWEIHTDCECTDGGYMWVKPCPHCRDVRWEPGHFSRDGKPRPPKVHWICPRVVVALNEAGHNSTGVCLDCILDAAEEEAQAIQQIADNTALARQLANEGRRAKKLRKRP